MSNVDLKDISEVDVAYKMLSNAGEPIHYKKLITDVIERKRKTVQSMAVAISEIYTMINMDSRFQHRGNGLWGLTEWNPPEVKRASIRGLSRTTT
ncbi:MAG: DNA-directed RNA polymerase subunit delta, partial [Selenomonadaceae bacterium]|nr:DNA-directed RNA polymerase subunit delta [Selenomonadaceae bacterium]